MTYLQCEAAIISWLPAFSCSMGELVVMAGRCSGGHRQAPPCLCPFCCAGHLALLQVPAGGESCRSVVLRKHTVQRRPPFAVGGNTPVNAVPLLWHAIRQRVCATAVQASWILAKYGGRCFGPPLQGIGGHHTPCICGPQLGVALQVLLQGRMHTLGGCCQRLRLSRQGL